MKKIPDKKLALKQQTLRTLRTLQLEDVVAGGNGTSVNAYGQTCTCTCSCQD